MCVGTAHADYALVLSTYGTVEGFVNPANSEFEYALILRLFTVISTPYLCRINWFLARLALQLDTRFLFLQTVPNHPFSICHTIKLLRPAFIYSARTGPQLVGSILTSPSTSACRV